MNRNKQKIISSLQLITKELPDKLLLEKLKLALEGGATWVQLRVKSRVFEDWVRIAYSVKQLCSGYSATFIVNDSVEVAKECGAHGVHLGQCDMHPMQARKILGNEAIIGGTANTIEAVRELVGFGVDYIGLGPFRWTSTKTKLSPVLGLEGVKRIVEGIGMNCIPIVVVGGLIFEDISQLKEVGTYGIAVCSSIFDALDVKETTRKFVHVFEGGSCG